MAARRTDAFGIARQVIIAAVATPPIYADRASGKTFPNPFAMVDDYLARLGLPPLDENGYAMAREGKLKPDGSIPFLQVVPLAKRYSNELRAASPPWPVQRALFALLTPAASVAARVRATS